MTGTSRKLTKLAITAAVSAVVIVLLCIYLEFDPSDKDLGRFFPKCPVLLLTGFQCPGCGIQRALHDFLHGNFIDGLSHNLFLPFSTGYLAFLIITRHFCSSTSSLRTFFWGRYGCYLYIALYFLWFIIRNILSI